MTPETDPSAPRQDAILDAAFRAFSSYGYKRTSMDDIAQGVGISRSALYLHYRNKEDIFQSLAIRHFDEALAHVANELADLQRPAVDTLAAAFAAFDGKVMDVVLGTPHGAELLEAGHRGLADVLGSAEARFLEVLTDWLSAKPMPPTLGTAADLAVTIYGSLKGLKSVAKAVAPYRAAQRQLAQMLALALGR